MSIHIALGLFLVGSFVYLHFGVEVPLFIWWARCCSDFEFECLVVRILCPLFLLVLPFCLLASVFFVFVLFFVLFCFYLFIYFIYYYYYLFIYLLFFFFFFFGGGWCWWVWWFGWVVVVVVVLGGGGGSWRFGHWFPFLQFLVCTKSKAVGLFLFSFCSGFCSNLYIIPWVSSVALFTFFVLGPVVGVVFYSLWFMDLDDVFAF